MADAPRLMPVSTSFPQGHKPSFYPFYFGLVVVASTVLVLALYNIMLVVFRAHHRRQRLFQMSNQSANPTSQSSENSSIQLVSTFKYSTKETEKQLADIECSVCLSNFEDGDDVRQLQRCKHAFHAPCIDMWLYSHADCPLCRAFVGPPVRHNLGTQQLSVTVL